MPDGTVVSEKSFEMKPVEVLGVLVFFAFIVLMIGVFAGWIRADQTFNFIAALFERGLKVITSLKVP